MRKHQVVFFFAVLLFCAAGSAHAQQTQFQKVYTFFDGQALGTDVYEAGDGYYIGGYEKSSNFRTSFLVKTDFTGKPEWTKKHSDVLPYYYNTPRYISHFIRIANNRFIFAATNVFAYNQTNIKLYLLDSLGNTLISRIYTDGSDNYDYGIDVLESTDSGFYILGANHNDTPVLLKTDSLLNQIWRKEYSMDPIPDKGYLIKRINVNEVLNISNILIAGNNSIIMISNDGTIVWQRNISGLIRSLTITNNILKIGLNNGDLITMNSNGTILDTRSFQYSINSMSELSDNGLILMQNSSEGNYITRIDNEGNIIWQKKVFGNGLAVKQTSDSGFIATGNYLDRYLWTFKTDSEGFNQFLTLISPHNLVKPGQNTTIRWLSSGREFINLEYSLNGGTNWNQITDNYPADSLYFDWEVPAVTSTNCLIRITASENPLISDISDSVFSIVPYNAYDYIAANEIKMWIGNNGDGSHSPLTDVQGLFWPGGEDAAQGAVFEDGLVFGGKVNGEIRAGGSTYRHGLVPGNVLQNNTSASPDNIRFQVWKIKKNTSMLSDSDRAKYEYNYNNWPVDLGAPWVDRNLDGIYTKGIDHPKFYGDETLFNVMNDFDSTTSKWMYGSNPTGLEIQCLTYGIDTTNGLKDAVFKQYKLINKSSNEIKDMYLSYWCDDDMGDANDDYVGVDTTLSLGYTWNGINNDAIYGSPPPAIGHMIIQGPIVPSLESDSARFDNGWRYGYRNLPATAFVLYIGGSSVYADPDLGVYDGTLQMYNYMHGLLWDGSIFKDPNTGEATAFCLSGDPVAGTGWYEGEGWPGGPWHGDRRYLLSSGPFNLAPGDTQEITIAIFMALGSDNVQSIAALRDKAAFIQEFYNNDLLKEINPSVSPIENFRLEQNYPNPFNSITNIEYTLPVKSRVTIKIYDILGREVKVFNQGEQVPWQYRVSFNASALASGVYIYGIEAVPVNSQGNPSTGSGQDFIQTKKMILLK